MKITCYDIKKSKQNSPELIKQKDVGCDSSPMDTPGKIADFVTYMLGAKDFLEERTHVIALSASGKILGIFQVGQGTSTACMVGSKEVFSRLIAINATAFVITHNHPSGKITPSNNDIELTRKLLEAGKVLDIPCLDHIITGDGSNYFSFKESGIIEKLKGGKY